MSKDAPKPTHIRMTRNALVGGLHRAAQSVLAIGTDVSEKDADAVVAARKALHCEAPAKRGRPAGSAGKKAEGGAPTGGTDDGNGESAGNDGGNDGNPDPAGGNDGGQAAPADAS